jgi:hypothetical protein
VSGWEWGPRQGCIQHSLAVEGAATAVRSEGWALWTLAGEDTKPLNTRLGSDLATVSADLPATSSNVLCGEGSAGAVRGELGAATSPVERWLHMFERSVVRR